MSYDYREKKIVAVLSSQLEAGVALNVIGHLSISIANNSDDLMGRKYLFDATGIKHLGISKYPLIITRVKESALKKTILMARLDTRILMADYPQQMLETGHDDELSEKLLSVSEDEIHYLGAILYGPSDVINSITGKFSLWRP